MSNAEIEVKMINFIAKQLHKESIEVLCDSKFEEDLGMDSIDIMELILYIESEYNIDFDFNNIRQCKTINDCIPLIQKEINE